MYIPVPTEHLYFRSDSDLHAQKNFPFGFGYGRCSQYLSGDPCGMHLGDLHDENVGEKRGWDGDHDRSGGGEGDGVWRGGYCIAAGMVCFAFLCCWSPYIDLEWCWETMGVGANIGWHQETEVQSEWVGCQDWKMFVLRVSVCNVRLCWELGSRTFCSRWVSHMAQCLWNATNRSFMWQWCQQSQLTNLKVELNVFHDAMISPSHNFHSSSNVETPWNVNPSQSQCEFTC